MKTRMKLISAMMALALAVPMQPALAALQSPAADTAVQEESGGADVADTPEDVTAGETNTDGSTEAPEVEPVYTVNVSFAKNGGNGTMNPLSVESGKTAKLPKNTFTRAGFKFAGWNTQKDGFGTKYADQAEVSELADEDHDGSTVTLFAQWKLNKPAIKSTKSTVPGDISVAFAKCSGISGYEIQCSTNKKFKSVITAEAGKNSASVKITGAVPNKKYYVRMRSYRKSGNSRVYSDWSKVKAVKVKNGSTIANTKAYMAIEADIKMSGSGTGYHSKLVMATPTSAVSYGIQYDQHAAAPYTGKAMAMIENVSSNNAGGQRYSRPGDISLDLGKTHHMMMTVDEKGNGDVYLDYKKIGSFSQPNLTQGGCYLRIESSARLNGDSVDATFSNIKCKFHGTYDPQKVLGWTEFKQNQGLNYQSKKDGSIRIFGTIQGIHGDWDSDYNSVSEILQFM